MTRLPLRLRTSAILMSALIMLALPTAAQAAPRLVPHGQLRFTAPIWVGGAGDGTSTLYVAEQRGIIWRVQGRSRTRLLDLRGSVKSGGEQGLLSIAFAENFRAGTGRLFVYFTRHGSGNGQVRQYRMRNGRIVSGSGRTIINVPLSPPDATNHNGGQLWHAAGNLLYLSVGDGGGGGDPAGNAQRLDRLTGKLLRIRPRSRGGYVIPSSNPFTTRAGARGEIWALGLRNPWRFSIDAPTGDIWIGDVGQGAREEVNRLRRGGPGGVNFGWPRMEGRTVYDASRPIAAGTTLTRPVFDYGRSRGECSVTGGVVYRGPVQALRGSYVFADWCRNKLLVRRSGGIASYAGVSGIASFGVGARGHVYAANQRNGRIYRVAG